MGGAASIPDYVNLEQFQELSGERFDLNWFNKNKNHEGYVSKEQLEKYLGITDGQRLQSLDYNHLNSHGKPLRAHSRNPIVIGMMNLELGSNYSNDNDTIINETDAEKVLLRDEVHSINDFFECYSYCCMSANDFSWLMERVIKKSGVKFGLKEKPQGFSIKNQQEYEQAITLCKREFGDSLYGMNFSIKGLQRCMEKSNFKRIHDVYRVKLPFKSFVQFLQSEKPKHSYLGSTDKTHDEWFVKVLWAKGSACCEVLVEPMMDRDPDVFRGISGNAVDENNDELHKEYEHVRRKA